MLLRSSGCARQLTVLHFRFEYEDAVSIGAGAPILILSERFEPFPDVLRLSSGVYI